MSKKYCCMEKYAIPDISKQTRIMKRTNIPLLNQIKPPSVLYVRGTCRSIDDPDRCIPDIDFLFDDGASYSSISQDMAEKLSVNYLNNHAACLSDFRNTSAGGSSWFPFGFIELYITEPKECATKALLAVIVVPDLSKPFLGRNSISFLHIHRERVGENDETLKINILDNVTNIIEYQRIEYKNMQKEGKFKSSFIETLPYTKIAFENDVYIMFDEMCSCKKCRTFFSFRDYMKHDCCKVLNYL